MKTQMIAVAAASALALSACTNVSPEAEAAGTTVAAGALAALSADALGASSGWTAVAGIAGATAGALYAQNRQKKQCAYYTGNGDEVVLRPC